MQTFKVGETRGVIRKLDISGRIVLPKEFRETLEINETDSLEIFLVKDGFYIRKI